MSSSFNRPIAEAGRSFQGMTLAIGAISVAAVGAAAAVGALAVSFASDFQTSMAQVQASTGMSAKEMESIRDIATSLYNQNLGEGFDDLAQSIATVKQVTQQEGDALEETTRNAIAFKDVFGEDVTESVKAADTMMRNFGISSDQAFNLLAQGAQKGLDKSGELLDSANEYAPHFNSLGFSANQMFDTFSAGLETGAFNLDKVGDAVKEFNIRSKDGSKTSSEAYAALGLDAAKMSQTFAAGGPKAQEAFRQIVQAISSVKDPVKKNAIGVGLFGTQFEDLEKDVIAAMGTARSQFDMTKSTMDEIVKIKYDTPGKALQGIGRQLQTGLLLPLGNALLPMLQKISDVMADVFPMIQNAMSQVGELIGPIVGQITDALSSMFGGTSAEEGFSQMFGGIMGIAGQYAESFKAIWAEVGPHVMSIFGSIGSVIKQLFPIILKIGAVFQQIAMKVIKFVTPIVTYLYSKLFPVLSKIFDFIANDVMPMVSGAIEAIMPKIMNVVDKIGSAMAAIFNVVKPILDALFEAFDYVFPVIKNIVSGAINAISGVIDGVITVFGGVIDFVTGVFSGNWEQAWQGIKDVFSGIFKTAGSILVFPINLAIDAINWVIGKLNSVSFDIPEWLGGGTFGISIPEIPKIEGFAEGGIVSSPQLAMIGEGGDKEVIVPINNSERSRGLWETAGRMLGVSSQPQQASTASTSPVFHYSPNIIIQGNADQSTIERAVKFGNDDFEKRLREYEAQQRRVSFA